MSCRRGLVGSIGVVGVMLLLSLWSWAQLAPDALIPVPWGRGAGLKVGTPFDAFLMMPIITAGIAAVFALLPRLESQGVDLYLGQDSYTAFWLGSIFTMGAIHAGVVLTIAGRPPSADTAGPAGLGLLLILLGTMVYRAGADHVLGIRTPWTVGNDEVWSRTHGFAGHLLTAIGGLVALSALWGNSVLPIALLVFGVVGLLGLVTAYSYLASRLTSNRAPAR